MLPSTTRGIGAFLDRPAPIAAQPSWRNVILADDDPAVLRFSSAVLTGAGFEVLVAADGQQARELIVQRPPDFLITDWKMPNLDGIELCRWVRQANMPHYVYTIVVSGRSEVRHMVEAISSGADDFFSKPIRPGELLSRMQAGTRILERERQLLFLSRYDALTEIFSRRTFFAALDEVWASTAIAQAPLSCVMFDLDNFKQVNDTLGHQMGDETIAAVASALRQLLPEGGVAGRYGGEEFCALLPLVDERAATAWADGLRAMIANVLVCGPGGCLGVTASFGVAESRPPMFLPQNLVQDADVALLAAKQAGRNCTVGFSTLR